MYEKLLNRDVGFSCGSGGIYRWHDGDGQIICNPTNNLRYVGKRTSIHDIPASRICPPCLSSVTHIFGQGNVP